MSRKHRDTLPWVKEEVRLRAVASTALTYRVVVSSWVRCRLWLCAWAGTMECCSRCATGVAPPRSVLALVASPCLAVDV
jgi:hypothetical protein